MTRRKLTAALRTALFLMLLLPLAAAGQATTDTTALPEALRPVRASLGEAYAKFDAVAALPHFAENSSVEFNGQVLSGKGNVSGWLSQMLASLASISMGTSSFVIRDGEVVETAPYTVVTANGEESGGRSETLWKRQDDGSWKVARLIVM